MKLAVTITTVLTIAAAVWPHRIAATATSAPADGALAAATAED